MSLADFASLMFIFESSPRSYVVVLSTCFAMKGLDILDLGDRVTESPLGLVAPSAKTLGLWVLLNGFYPICGLCPQEGDSRPASFRFTSV